MAGRKYFGGCQVASIKLDGVEIGATARKRTMPSFAIPGVLPESSRRALASELQGVIQICTVPVLFWLVHLGGAARRLGATELAARGLDRRGKWVGFPAARKVWGIKGGIGALVMK